MSDLDDNQGPEQNEQVDQQPMFNDDNLLINEEVHEIVEQINEQVIGIVGQAVEPVVEPVIEPQNNRGRNRRRNNRNNNNNWNWKSYISKSFILKQIMTLLTLWGIMCIGCTLTMCPLREWFRYNYAYYCRGGSSDGTCMSSAFINFVSNKAWYGHDHGCDQFTRWTKVAERWCPIGDLGLSRDFPNILASVTLLPAGAYFLRNIFGVPGGGNNGNNRNRNNNNRNNRNNRRN